MAGYSEYDHSGNDGDHGYIENVVRKHGAATSHHHHTDGSEHHVVTNHPDGHTHASFGHPNYPHAHEHLAIAHGIA